MCSGGPPARALALGAWRRAPGWLTVPPGCPLAAWGRNLAGMHPAQEVAAMVRDVLGGNVLGTHLHGSAVLQGLRPASDVDVLVVLGGSSKDSSRSRGP